MPIALIAAELEENVALPYTTPSVEACADKAIIIPLEHDVWLCGAASRGSLRVADRLSVAPWSHRVAPCGDCAVATLGETP